MIKPNNWEKIEQIFNAAAVIDDEAAQRKFVIDQAGNSDLSADILRLLENDRQEDSFLKDPVYTLGARILTETEDRDLIERKDFGHYHLLKVLGRGGMGVVFLAQDTRLNRKIALKVLPKTLAEHQETVARFKQEARAASNVAHKSVAHIYDFGELENRYYLAMEYVAGHSLRELIEENSADRSRAIDIATQVASALEAAHESGITHRDIKPENIMVMEDGTAKVLDFGLAKIEPAKNQISQNTSLETVPGLIMGTTSYMSPEQVRGEEITQATDIWSLGVILYEMLVGERPFTGKTPSDIRASILRDEPQVDNLSPSLKNIFQKALHKDKEDRFQSIKEFRQALEELKDHPTVFQNETGKTSAGKNSGKPLIRSKIFTGKALLLFSFLLIAVAGLFVFLQSKKTLFQTGTDQYRITRLTGSGNALYAAISPDGESAVYALEPRTGEAGLFVRSLKSGKETVLIEPGAIEFTGVSYSPDGQYIYYASKPADGIIASLYRIPANTDSNRKEPQFILEDIDSAPGFSPDGKQFAYLKIDPDGKYEEIAVANSDGSNAHSFYRRKMPDFIPHQAQPSWSANGEKIILSAGTTQNGIKTNEVIAVRVSDKQVEKINNSSLAQISKTVWFKNENSFLMSGRKTEAEDSRQILRLRLPGGEINQLTNDFHDYSDISINSSGNEIITLAGENTADLWLSDLDENSAAARQITSGGNESKGVVYAPDGRIVYSSNQTGKLQIWIANENGSDKKQLTDDEFSNTEPAVSPDGKLIAYVSTRAGSRNIWLMDVNGQNQRKLTGGSLESNPVFTKDGKHVLYFNYNSAISAISRVSLENNEIKVLLEGTRRYPTISPDGKWLLSSYRPPGESANKLAVVPLDNPTSAPRVFEPLPGASSPGVVRWAHDGNSFFYIVTKSGASNIFKQPIDGSAPIKITSFANDRIYWFDFSADGKRLITSRGNQKRFVTLLQK